MGKRVFPKAASSSDRSKASRLRRKAARDGKLKRDERQWLRRYESERKRLKKGIGRPVNATPQERRRAAYLRKKRRDGKKLNREERSELRAYEKARTQRKKPSRAPKRSARFYADKIRGVITGWLNATDPEYLDKWYMKPARGRPGIAIADAEWDEASLPNQDENGDVEAIEPDDFPASTGYLANVKLKWSFYGDDGDEKRVRWLSVIPMTADWLTIPNDLAATFEFDARPSMKTRDGESLAAITGVSIFVSPPKR